MWQDGKESYQAEDPRAKEPHGQSGLAGTALARCLSHHGMRLAPEEQLAASIEQNCRAEQDNHQREREGICPDVLDAIKNLHRGDAGEVEHERHAQLGKRPDENNRPACEDARHDERKGDAAEFAESGATKILGRLLHRRIHICEGGEDIEIEDRVEVQGIENNDAPYPPLAQPVDRMGRVEQADVLQKGIQRALLAQDLFDANRSNERRHDHWHKHQRAEEGFSGKKETVTHPSERNRNERGEQCAPDTHLERVPESLDIERIPENLGDVVDRKLSIRSDKSPIERLTDRPEKEQREENGCDEEDESGELLTHFPSRANLAVS